jgi:photosystem II stability/assembly factor-like uncharacterized protein
MPNIPDGGCSKRIGTRGAPLPFSLAFSLALLLSGWNAHAETESPWMPLPNRASWAVDSSWGLRIDKGGSRFASGFFGDPYVSLGDSLFLGNDGGKTWTGIAYQKSYAHRRPMPISVGTPGLIAWGNKVSPDSGRTWIRPADYDRLPSALSVLIDNTILAGRVGDEMIQSADSGKTWAQVIRAMDFGTFLDIQETIGSWIFAAPQLAPPLFSRDVGRTWSPLRSNLKSPFTIQPVTYMAVETRHFQQSAWLVAGARTGYPCLVEVPIWGGEDSLEAVQTWISGIPENIISAFAVWNDWNSGVVKLWLGTWGSGLYVSTDKGKTWQPDNAGLSDPYVEDLWVSKDGAMLVLTKSGMFRRGTPTTSIVIKPRGHSSGAGKRMAVPGLLRSATGGLYRADGRNVAPHPLLP